MRIESTVLLVDDDKDDLEMLEEALRIINPGHQVVEAHNGEEALDSLNTMLDKGELPCLIVLDINMPKLDGKQTFMKIKANNKLAKIPIVIFSTSTSVLDRNFFERHRTAYFIKPINFAEFTKTASRMISHCQSNGI
jgi:CheY-like chemotaxis protein